ncbi:uncharacterized protein EV422DRAFT_548085 [Fimicolochytrium jonesii]|uniref:uncharacterized protein n=1 Tax=Fimicolochytrium jonesii TaxID=1396493 RepID=UPI0022FDF4F2|nr:uncharacterized protein EV422DRAFT_548085 [Fimicolochytrium jonesii]KAI8815808.1 hypothetical protein EV422DRAFT_548085 [Fimicolochytrium jonesii]
MAGALQLQHIARAGKAGLFRSWVAPKPACRPHLCASFRSLSVSPSPTTLHRHTLFPPTLRSLTAAFPKNASPQAPLQTRSVSEWQRTKVASKRKTKKYKLKNHGGAVARWMVSGDGTFKRGQAGRRHLNSKMRVWKRKSKKRRVLANTTQKKLLKKLVPYWKKKYLR